VTPTTSSPGVTSTATTGASGLTATSERPDPPTSISDPLPTPDEQDGALSGVPASGDPSRGAGLDLVWLEERGQSGSSDDGSALRWAGSLIGIAMLALAGYRYWRARQSAHAR
jgi:hypothetical protein